MDDISGGELHGVETDRIRWAPQITPSFTDELFYILRNQVKTSLGIRVNLW